MMKKYEFVTIKAHNNPVKDAIVSEHRNVIAEYAEKGYGFVGWVPTRFGASGKMLEMDLVFVMEE